MAEASGSRRFGGRSKTGKKVRPTGARSRNPAILSGIALFDGIEGKGLDVLTAASRRKAAGRHGKPVA